MPELLLFVRYVVTLYMYVVIANVVLSWLFAFNVINYHNGFVRALAQGINALTEPLLRPIRRFMPDLGGIDLSPMILLLGCIFVTDVIIPNLLKAYLAAAR
ncbi:MAG: YggT family protein [Pseudomonadota bacterium]